jgi:hypothetical protein
MIASRAQQAREVYGVSIDAVKMEIDEEATRKLRKGVRDPGRCAWLSLP